MTSDVFARRRWTNRTGRDVRRCTWRPPSAKRASCAHFSHTARERLLWTHAAPHLYTLPHCTRISRYQRKRKRAASVCERFSCFLTKEVSKFVTISTVRMQQHPASCLITSDLSPSDSTIRRSSDSDRHVKSVFLSLSSCACVYQSLLPSTFSIQWGQGYA